MRLFLIQGTYDYSGSFVAPGPESNMGPAEDFPFKAWRGVDNGTQSGQTFGYTHEISN